MPRLPRIDIPGLTYHITCRGVKRLPLFFDNKDREQFLHFLSMTQLEYPFRLHAYCLMTNHYHLLLETVRESLSRTLHRFQRAFAIWHNRKYKQVGHVFEARFHSIPVQKDAYFTTVSRYIHLNPVRARIVSRPEDYPWSNYGRLVRGEPDPWVDPSFLLDYFGYDTLQQRRKYQEFVEEKLGEPEVITEAKLRRQRYWGQPAKIFKF